MGLRRDVLNQVLLKNATASTDAYESARAKQHDVAKQKSSQDHALSQLIKGDELKQAEYDKQLQTAQDLRAKYGQETDIDAGAVRIGGVDPLMQLLRRRELSKPSLTPAQEYSEREAGKKLSAYEVSGGSPAIDKHMRGQTEVTKELQEGGRDWYDRAAGKVLGSTPRLLGVLAPTEKARMDRVQAAALQNIRATDPNPTQVMIDQTLTRAYDPRADDETNIRRIQEDYATAKATKAQMEQASQNLSRTGYAMPGLAGNAPQQPAQPQTKVVGGVTYIKTARGWEEQ